MLCRLRATKVQVARHVTAEVFALFEHVDRRAVAQAVAASEAARISAGMAAAGVAIRGCSIPRLTKKAAPPNSISWD